MQNPIYVGVSGQISLEKRMETIARNMANVNTTGYRSEEMKFASLVSPVARDNNQNVNFSSAGQTYISTNRGPVTQTGNPLDVAVNGDSYFSLQTPTGQVYTRDGRMIMTPEGGLVSVQGYPFLDNGGAPIQIDPANGTPRIAADGAIYQNNLQVAAIGLYQFQPDSKLIYQNNLQVAAIGLYQFQPDSKLSYGPNASVVPDNVNGVVEMTRLIEVSRAFERVEAMMRQQEERSTQAIQTLGGKNQ